MPADAVIWIVAILGMFAVFGVGVGYVSAIATARAITYEEEQKARGK